MYIYLTTFQPKFLGLIDAKVKGFSGRCISSGYRLLQALAEVIKSVGEILLLCSNYQFLLTVQHTCVVKAQHCNIILKFSQLNYFRAI